MWLRNLLFLGLVGGGIFSLGANLWPPRASSRHVLQNADAHRSPEFLAAVATIDTSFRRQWAEQKLRAAPPAADLAVARRLALALMGTIPSLEEIRRFERSPAHERLDWWLNRVLLDRRFADYFAERLARACVGTEDGPFLFYRRRRLVAWLADQVEQNRPYDELVRELIASSGLWTGSPATNFVSVTVQPDNKNQPDPVRLAGRVTRAFLGVRLDCAQCHDHPFAPWKQDDFQGLAAFFAQAHLGFTGIHDGDGEYEAEDHKSRQKRIVAPRVPFAPELLPESGSRRRQFAWWLTDAKNPYFARATVNRVWALLLGAPLVEPVDSLDSSDTPAPPALALLAADFAEHGFDLRRLIRLIAATQVFQMDSAADHEAADTDANAWTAFPLTRLRPEQVAGSVAQAASVTTIDAASHILVRIARHGDQDQFVKRYGDSGEDEFAGRGGTIPQRLLLMNGALVRGKIKKDPFHAPTRIAWMSPNDAHAVETAFLAVLTRRPTPEESAHFEKLLADKAQGKPHHLEDLFWVLINSTEFSWNH